MTEWINRHAPTTATPIPLRRKSTRQRQRNRLIEERHQADLFDDVCTELRGDWSTQNSKAPKEVELAALEHDKSPHEPALREELLRTEVTINNTVARVLIDAGATHNVVTTSFCTAANIYLDNKRMSKVAVSTLLDGGAEVNAYPNVKISISMHGWKHTVDCIAMDSDSRYDIILGKPWHYDHNPVINWTTNEIEVKHDSKPPTQFKAIDNFNEDTTAYGFNTITMTRARQLPENKLAQIYWVNISDEKETTSENGVAIGVTDEDILRIVKQYADVIPEEIPAGLPAKRDEQHEINLIPGAALPRPRGMRLSYDMTMELRKQVDRLLKLGWIRPSKSPVGAGAFFSKKPDGTWRFICDWRALNDITIKDSTTLPNIEDSLNLLRDAKYFSKLDLHSGFYQVRIREEDCWKSAIQTCMGTYEWLVMPMGLSNSPATFQRLMNGVMKGLVGKFVIVYLDDILIYSNTLDEHKVHLTQVLQTLRKAKLYCKPKKCLIATRRLQFLGHVVENGTITADPEKTKAVKEMKQPRNVHDVRSFIGFANYFRKYIRGFSEIAIPLHKLTHKHATFTWTAVENKAWEDLKKALTSTPVLQLPDWSKTFIIQTDASEFAIGAALMQGDDDDRVVIAYRNKVLSDTKKNWGTHERELWAIVDAVDDWRPYIQNRFFQVETDHKPLLALLHQKNLSHKQARWVTKLAEYNMKLIYKAGKTQVIADCLSRPSGMMKSKAPIPKYKSEGEDIIFGEGINTMIDDSDPTNDDIEWNNFSIGTRHSTWKEDCAKAYVEDDFFKKLNVKENSRWQRQENTGLIHLVEGDNIKRLCVPTHRLQQLVISECHDNNFMAHPGENRLIDYLRKSFFWPKMKKMAHDYVKSCERCQKSKPRQGNLPGLQQPLPVPMACWEEVSMDFMTSLPRSQRGNDMLMVVVDRLSKQAHFIPVKSTHGATEIAKIYHDMIFRHHGIPKAIISDRDPRFTADFWTELWTKLGTRLKMSTANHPQTDGQTEVVNRVINSMLRTTLQNDDWESRLPDIEFAYNSMTNRTTGKSPFEIVYGYLPRTPITLNSERGPTDDSFEELTAEVRDAMTVAQQASKDQTDQHRTETLYKVGDLVLLHASRMEGGPRTQRTSKHKWQEQWRGPYTITDIHGNNAYTLAMPSSFRGHTTFNIQFLKEWIIGATPLVASNNHQDNDGDELTYHYDFDDAHSVDSSDSYDTTEVILHSASETAAAPTVRRSSRGRIPNPRYEVATTEMERGGMKYTLLQDVYARANCMIDRLRLNNSIDSSLE